MGEKVPGIDGEVTPRSNTTLLRIETSTIYGVLRSYSKKIGLISRYLMKPEFKEKSGYALKYDPS